MLEQKYLERFQALLNGDIDVSDLSEEEAHAFAEAISASEEVAAFDSKGDARQYLQTQLDAMDIVI
jgi:hypothetical protein